MYWLFQKIICHLSANIDGETSGTEQTEAISVIKMQTRQREMNVQNQDFEISNAWFMRDRCFAIQRAVLDDRAWYWASGYQAADAVYSVPHKAKQHHLYCRGKRLIAVMVFVLLSTDPTPKGLCVWADDTSVFAGKGHATLAPLCLTPGLSQSGDRPRSGPCQSWETNPAKTNDALRREM